MMNTSTRYITTGRKGDLACFVVLAMLLLAGAKNLGVYYKAPRNWKAELAKQKSSFSREFRPAPQAR